MNMDLFAVKLVAVLVAYLEFSLTPASGNIACEFVEIFGGWCDTYERLKFNGSLLACSYMCALTKPASCYNTETKESPCLIFGVHTRNGACINGTCTPMNEALEYFKNKQNTPKTTLDCEHGHDYLYDKYGPFGCKYYCKHNGKPANRPDGTVCQRPDTTKKGICDEYGYCVKEIVHYG
ncbi:uncharacterized protein LOC135398198 [Ornithodoros turicata]|uniref:uncharacterized protein LOC135398198 n=1 Tax=Ornithodoros turicata TaxID=34597 RepID=UPI00313A0A34